MHPDWKNFLSTLSADIEDNNIPFFGDSLNEARAAIDGNIIADCSNFGILRFSGEDARNFIHNQLSNDVNALQEDQSRLAAYCNPKGRALAVTRLYNHGDDIYLVLPRDIIGAVAKRLQMFVLMSKVTITDISDNVVVCGLAGDAATGQLLSQHIKVPTAAAGVSQQDGLTVIRLPYHSSRFLVIAEVDRMQALWQAVASTMMPVGQAAWQLLDIYTGQPQVFAETAESFVPQMLNMHAIDGISFKKGCYPGQEIVARMYYLGKLKRRMYRAHATTDTSPLPGEPLVAAHSSSGQGAGEVVMASPSPAGGFDLLVVCPVSIVDSGSIHLGADTGPEIVLADLPYEVPLERDAG